jgi:3',5'-cyclic AMP phosphodiesterase CpdA
MHPSAASITLDERPLFVFSHISDTHLSGSKTVVEEVINWLVKENISLVIHTGDIVDRKYDKQSWEDASELMHRLDETSLWAVLAGNHDVTDGNFDSANFHKYFSNQSMDQYLLVQDKLLFILFGWNNIDGSLSAERLEWMDSVIETHKDNLVVICLHPHLFGMSLFNIFGTPNYEEIWSHIDKHDNVIMTLCGHIHFNWVQIKGMHNVWSISTEALKDRGYIRLFNVYQDRIEIYAYSPWINQEFIGSLDRFTIEFGLENHDIDGDLWDNALDIMPTHPLFPNGVLISLGVTILLLIGWYLLGSQKLSNIFASRIY